MTNLDSNVLVLNRHWQPVNVTSVRRAFALLYAGAAKAIDREFQTFDFESWSELSAELGSEVSDREIVRTVNQVLKVPRVIILQVFDRFPRARVRFSRQNIYLRDQLTCQYCRKSKQRSELNLDHVIPRSQGGKTTWENVVCSCIRCNMKKGGRTPEQAGMKLLRKPVRPRWSPLAREFHGKPHDAWRPFLSMVDASYWNTELVEDE